MDEQSKLKYAGRPVYLDGRNYYIPSLSTKDFRRFYAEIGKELPEGATAVDALDKQIPIILAAITRNYPEISAEYLEEHLDLESSKEAYLCALNQSGAQLVTVAPGE